MSSSEESKQEYKERITELMQITSKKKHKSEINDNLSSAEESSEMDSLDVQPPQYKSNIKYKNIRSTKSHRKDKKHRKERDVREQRRHRNHHRETKSEKDLEVSASTAGRYYKEQTCMDDFPRDSRCMISDKRNEHRAHRYKDEISTDLAKQFSSKRSFESDEDFYNDRRRKKHKENKRHKETEKWDSILQSEKAVCVTESSNTDIRKDRNYKTQLNDDSPEGDTSENENIEQMLRIKKLLQVEEELTTLERQKVDDMHSEYKGEKNTVSDTSNHELEVNRHNDVTDPSTYSEGEIISDESLKVSAHSDNKDENRQDSVESTPVLEERLPNPSLTLQIPDSQLSESDNDLDTHQFNIATDGDMPPYYPAIQGCRSVNEFQILNHINEGTYGVVYRARDKHNGEIVALKRLKMENEKEGFPITSLREINTLLKGQHPNIVTVREIVMGTNLDKIFIVMDFVEHDLKSLIEVMRHKKQSFTAAEVKCLLKQLLCAVAYLHDNWILHRDLKTSNLLLSQNGILKVGDFGLAREYGSPLRAYTPIVVTLWYRAPELLLCTKTYSTHIDVWSVGCIFGELVLMNPIFQGKSEIDQLFKIFKILGTPNETSWPGFNKLPAVQKIKFTQYPTTNLRSRFNMLTVRGHALLQGLLTYDPTQRITAQDALEHPYFKESPLPIDPSMFPSWPGNQQTVASNTVSSTDIEKARQLDGKGDEDTGFRINPSVMENRKLPTGGGFNLKF